MQNKDIREFVRLHRIRMWEVASEAKISEPTLCRWMRTELTPEHRQKIEQAMHRLAERQIKNVI